MPALKVKVHRTKHGEETVTGFSYTDPEKPDSMRHFAADEKKDEFEMTPAQAAAAVETGGFAVAKSSKSETEDSTDTQPLSQ